MDLLICWMYLCLVLQIALSLQLYKEIWWLPLLGLKMATKGSSLVKDSSVPGSRPILGNSCYHLLASVNVEKHFHEEERANVWISTPERALETALGWSSAPRTASVEGSTRSSVPVAARQRQRERGWSTNVTFSRVTSNRCWLLLPNLYFLPLPIVWVQISVKNPPLFHRYSWYI